MSDLAVDCWNPIRFPFCNCAPLVHESVSVSLMHKLDFIEGATWCGVNGICCVTKVCERAAGNWFWMCESNIYILLFDWNVLTENI